MQLDRFSPPVLIRLLALASALVFTGLAHADDYSDVNQLLKSGKGTEALAKADKYLADKPKDPQMRFLKGVIQTQAGNTTEAIATFTALTQDYPELPEPYNNLAALLASQNQLERPAPRWRWPSVSTPATPLPTKTWVTSTPVWPTSRMPVRSSWSQATPSWPPRWP